ncbi:hypothetical protein PR048_021757 [Dryococelus australis]|uniref:Uncharacterized protein n=1 Tax=Dryococelus australis TaxID=614101 RepID=A0ABQ9GZ30_9NEOP|nr:hypothetical protein PR048_021757 [Dryococelus australis]
MEKNVQTLHNVQTRCSLCPAPFIGLYFSVYAAGFFSVPGVRVRGDDNVDLLRRMACTFALMTLWRRLCTRYLRGLYLKPTLNYRECVWYGKDFSDVPENRKPGEGILKAHNQRKQLQKISEGHGLVSRPHVCTRLKHVLVVRCTMSHMVPDDAAARRDLSGFSRLPCPFIPPQLHTQLNHPHRLSRPRSYEPPKSLHSFSGAPSRTAAFTRQVSRPLVNSHHEHLVRRCLAISRRRPSSKVLNFAPALSQMASAKGSWHWTPLIIFLRVLYTCRLRQLKWRTVCNASYVTTVSHCPWLPRGQGNGRILPPGRKGRTPSRSRQEKNVHYYPVGEMSAQWGAVQKETASLMRDRFAVTANKEQPACLESLFWGLTLLLALMTLARLLAFHLGEPVSIPTRVAPNFRKWYSCQTMPLFGGFSRVSPVSPALAFRRWSILISFHPHDSRIRVWRCPGQRSAVIHDHCRVAQERCHLVILGPCALPFLLLLDDHIFPHQDKAQPQEARVFLAYLRDVNVLSLASEVPRPLAHRAFGISNNSVKREKKRGMYGRGQAYGNVCPFGWNLLLCASLTAVFLVVCARNDGHFTNRRDVSGIHFAHSHVRGVKSKVRFCMSVWLPEVRYKNIWGHDGRAVRLLASHEGELGSITGRVTPGFSHVGIVPDDAAYRQVILGMSRLPHPFIPMLLHSRLTSPSSALRTPMLRAA